MGRSKYWFLSAGQISRLSCVDGTLRIHAIMKSKELANVLIKILGLSVCIHAIPTFVSGILYSLTSFQLSQASYALTRVFSYATTAIVEVAAGFVLIVLSRKIADLLFKSDEE